MDTRYLVLNKLISPPGSWFFDSIILEVQAGSRGWDVHTNQSDHDILAITIPPEDIVFPYLKGQIPGFHLPEEFPIFTGLKKPGLKAPDTNTYDYDCYAITKYFRHAIQSSPFFIEGLFFPKDKYISLSPVGELLLANREVFLSKALFKTFGGFANSEFKDYEKTGNLKTAARALKILAQGRLLLEHHNLDDLQLFKQHFIDIRSGKKTQVDLAFDFLDQCLNKAYHDTTLPITINTTAVTNLLHQCLALHYGEIK